MFFRSANKFLARKPANPEQNPLLRCKIMLQCKKFTLGLVFSLSFGPV